MEIIHWNAGYGSKIEKVDDLLKRMGGDVIALLEVTPGKYEYLREQYKDRIVYSLDYRKPGKYDSRGRKLGIALIMSDEIEILDSGVFERALLPDRTLWAVVRYKGTEIKIASFHSITGCDHKKAKSMFFNSIAEAVDEYRPDIVTIDANEPDKDFYIVEGMKFFDRNGPGAKNFFTCLKEIGLTDSYAVNYDSNNYVEGEPLIPSHYIQGKSTNAKRYDFIFVNDTYKVGNVEYLMKDAMDATGDHALVKTIIEKM